MLSDDKIKKTLTVTWSKRNWYRAKIEVSSDSKSKVMEELVLKVVSDPNAVEHESGWPEDIRIKEGWEEFDVK